MVCCFWFGSVQSGSVWSGLICSGFCLVLVLVLVCFVWFCLVLGFLVAWLGSVWIRLVQSSWVGSDMYIGFSVGSLGLVCSGSVQIVLFALRFGPVQPGLFLVFSSRIWINLVLFGLPFWSYAFWFGLCFVWIIWTGSVWLVLF